MTAYLLTPALHAQLVDALSQSRQTAMSNVMAARIPESGDFAGIAQNLDWVVAMLEAMKPTEPKAFICHGYPYLHPSQDDYCGNVEDHIQLYTIGGMEAKTDRESVIDKLWENSNHGTRREDVLAAYEAGRLCIKAEALK